MNSARLAPVTAATQIPKQVSSLPPCSQPSAAAAMLLGVSTSILSDKDDFDCLSYLDPQVVEFYNYPSTALPRIMEFRDLKGIAVALHTPMAYDEDVSMLRFAPTGGPLKDRRAALEVALSAVRCAASLEAVHVVVHFPSPYADCAEPVHDQEIDDFLGPLLKEAEELNVSVLVENLSAHPTFHSPEHYLSLSRRYESLNYCLDFGHAADLSPTGLEDFIRVLGPKIHSCHVYNRRRFEPSGHFPLHPTQTPAEGWIDIPKTVTSLKRAGGVRTWILEPDPVTERQSPMVREGANWLRKLVGETTP